MTTLVCVSLIWEFVLPRYKFSDCAKQSITNTVGCRLPWDDRTPGRYICGIIGVVFFEMWWHLPKPNQSVNGIVNLSRVLTQDICPNITSLCPKIEKLSHPHAFQREYSLCLSILYSPVFYIPQYCVFLSILYSPVFCLQMLKFAPTWISSPNTRRSTTRYHPRLEKKM